jgi:serine protease Do
MRFAVLTASVAVLVTACSGGGALPAASPATQAPSAAPTAAETAAPTAAATATATPTPESGGGAPNNPVTSLEGVKGAVIQIEANGTFLDPEVGQLDNAAGRGSGFFIDPSGLAVTNNHVVTGAAFLKVWVGGNKEDVKNAKVIGVSECSDLAVIQVLGIDSVPFLKWYSGDIQPGLDIYAAGFPLGDPEYTLRKGIVSKAKADGDTSWASVDSVIEHDAATNPGNSGGPLVTPDGQVVAINYAGDEAGQRFAVSEVEAMKVLDQLREGKNVTSIGVNGIAVNDGKGISGIWVSSVESGSAADNAGVKPGDVITRLEGLVLSTDGTMADYCDILRSHNPGDVLSVQVLRFSTKEILEGQLNGRALAVTSSFGDVAPDTGDGQTPAEDDYPAYQTVTDESGTLSMEVPEAWSDFRGGSWGRNGETVGVGMNASPDVKKWLEGFAVSGVFIGASKSLVSLGVEKLLDEESGFQKEQCTYSGRRDFDDGVHVGKFDVFEKCGGGDASAIVLVATPQDESYILAINVTVLNDRDIKAADRVVSSFKVLKPLP